MTILMAVAQVQQPSVLDLFRNQTGTECVSIDYEFSIVLSGLKTTGGGTVVVQGNAYHMQGDGFEMFCDGNSTWMIDEVSKEVVIESADSQDAGLLANPIILLMNLDEYGISYVVDGDKITLSLPDGTELVINVLKMTEISRKKPEAFRPPVEFSNDWIVTDLR